MVTTEAGSNMGGPLLITVDLPCTDTCRDNVECILSTYQRLGVPFAPAKCVGPTIALVFLGFELDMEKMVVCLHLTLQLVQCWVGNKACQK